jgi:hypothetical protein
MPCEIRLTGESRPRIKVPILGLSGQVSFEEIALLDGFRFDEGKPPTGVNEYRVVVQEGADRRESSAWTEPPAIPLTDEEQAAWARADSAARNTPFIRKVGEGVGAAARLASDPGFFHYNRVDGFSIGAAHDWHASPDIAFTTKLGYALGSRDWQYRLGSRVCLSEPARLWVGAWYHDETVARPTLVSSHYDPTFRALFAHADPLDYYRERGLGLSLEMKVFDLTRLSLMYNDARQSSLETLTSYPFDWTRHPPSGNPPIRDGHLRSVSASLAYDSRQFLRTGGQDLRLSPPSWTAASIGLEIAAPSVIPNDFSYRRYTLALGRAQATPGLGTTTVSLAAGIATGAVPPQRFFTVDFGMEFLAIEGRGFTTLNRTNFYGNRALMLMVRHDFGRLLFARSGLPLVRNLPFNLSLNGGVFWTDFSKHALIPIGAPLASAPKPYAEAGFALGNLTPFLSPFNLSVHFAWQLSSYPTRRFRFGIGITGS